MSSSQPIGINSYSSINDNLITQPLKKESPISRVAFKILTVLAIALAIPTLGISLLVLGVVHFLYKRCKKTEKIERVGNAHLCTKQTQEQPSILAKHQKPNDDSLKKDLFKNKEKIQQFKGKIAEIEEIIKKNDTDIERKNKRLKFLSHMNDSLDGLIAQVDGMLIVNDFLKDKQTVNELRKNGIKVELNSFENLINKDLKTCDDFDEIIKKGLEKNEKTKIFCLLSEFQNLSKDIHELSLKVLKKWKTT